MMTNDTDLGFIFMERKCWHGSQRITKGTFKCYLVANHTGYENIPMMLR
jgi:hypothetical protein